jgi:Niemann-Pick C1 protein
MGDSS